MDQRCWMTQFEIDSVSASATVGGHGTRRMKRVAVFGNAGGGKSTLARCLAELTRLPLHTIDTIKFRAGGVEVAHSEYLETHADLIRRDEWIIDGFGCVASAWERFSAADTLIYVDLPLLTHCRWVTKRLIKGLFASPPGWPENSPVWSSSIQSYRVLWLCHRRLTPRYRQLVADAAASKRAPGQIRVFLETVKKKHMSH
jgi:adenylate kinase family enzyme